MTSWFYRTFRMRGMPPPQPIHELPPLSHSVNFPPDLPREIDAVWKLLLETSPIAIVLVDQEGHIWEANAAFRALVPPDTTGDRLSLYTLVKENEHALLASRLHDGMSVEPLELHLQGESARSAALYMNRISALDSAPGRYWMVGYLIDTTEQKNLEERMVHSQRMQAVGQLAGGIAHDFNNLLTAMIGFCDLLLTRHPPGEQSFADIMQIKQNANRAANLVRQLLAFSRKQTLQPEVVDITETLAELSFLLRRLLGENIELKISHERDLWKTRVDIGQLEQVIINLSVNGRDAMKGKGSLSIRTCNRSINEGDTLESEYLSPGRVEAVKHGDFVVIEVSDTGCGMSTQLLEHIFEPFFTTKGIGEGTGLGLATVFGIMEQTGGHIFVKSEIGVGTTFLLFLPRYDGVIEEAPAKVQDEKPKDLTGSGKLLLVEDEDAVRMFATRALANKGYQVLAAENAEVAMELFNEQHASIDLIITDVMMPGMSGPEMVKEMVQIRPEVRVVFISGYGEDEFMKSFGDARNFDFLPKPFTLKQLAEKVKDILDARSPS